MFLHFLSLFICIFTEVGCQESCMWGAIRLVGGRSQLEGRVEICLNDMWGTVCDDLWGQNDASVVCRQLGFSSLGAVPYETAYFGQGSGPIFLDNVQCRGGEQRLINCSNTRNHNCGHHEDAGVRCEGILALTEVNITDVSVLVSWRNNPVAVKYDVTITHIVNNTRSGIITEVPGSETVFVYEELLPEQNYTVCVTGYFDEQQAILSCREFQTLPQPISPAPDSTLTSSPTTFPSSCPTLPQPISPAPVASANSALLGGILGSIIAVLVLLLIMAGVGLAYPRCIRRRVKDKKCRCIRRKDSGPSNNSQFLGMISNEAYIERSQQLTSSQEANIDCSQQITANKEATEDPVVYETISNPPTGRPTPRKLQRGPSASQVTAEMAAQLYEICEFHPTENPTHKPAAYEVLERVATDGGVSGRQPSDDADDYLQLQY